MQVTVVGLGHVGLVTAGALASNGHDVVGVDIDGRKISLLKSGRLPIHEPGLPDLLADGLRGSGRLRFSHTDEATLERHDIALIAVGTPSLPNGAADLSQVRASLDWVVGNAPPGLVVVMKSTVPPGTGVKLLEQYFAHSGTQAAYAANPEFLREGQAVHDWFHPDRIVIGAHDAAAAQTATRLYQGIEAPLIVTDVTSAELIKYTANAFLATKISFVNEIARLCDFLRGNIDEVVRGISLDPRIGASFLRPGLGYGGSCFPKDVRALGFVSSHDFELLKAVINVNNAQRLLPMRYLRHHFETLQQVPVVVLGLAFKPNTDDVREAPALDLIRLLWQEGAVVRACDPKAVENAKGLLPADVALFDDAMAALEAAQVLVLATEWDEFVNGIDWRRAFELMAPPRVVFDGRNALDPRLLKSIGFQYRGVGRS